MDIGKRQREAGKRGDRVNSRRYKMIDDSICSIHRLAT